MCATILVTCAIYGEIKHMITMEQDIAHDIEQICELGKAVVETEAAAVKDLLPRIDKNFAKACQTLLMCDGRIVVIGMGKSGHIAKKIAATLASTGSPAFFVHPAEASHGDLGMITKGDVVIAISNSGKTNELLTIVPLIKRHGIPLISLTGDARSILARDASVNLDISVQQEACPLGLAPTSSTTVALVMGDALAIALLRARGFSREDFALTHPAGSLGRKLLLRIENIMHTEEAIPRVYQSATIAEAVTEMTDKRLGMTVVLNEKDELVGIYTDGDVRRTLGQNLNIHNTPVATVMTANCKTINRGILVDEALYMMEQHSITSLVVTEERSVIGVIHLHQLIRAGVM